MTYSFDVFDTCIVRTLARPVDVFYLLAEQVLAQRAAPYGQEEIFELASLRVAAEKAAHRASFKQEITLADIYNEMPELSRWGVDARQMQEAEMGLELSLMRPVASTRARVAALKAAGERVIYISDMYLPRKVIKRMLLNCGYEVPDDTLYLSSDLDATKRAGTLYRYVLEQEGLEAAQLSHTGDSLESDVLGARKAGVRSTLFSETQLNRFEKAMLKVPSRSPWVASQLAGIARVTRLSDLPAQEMQGAHDIAASVIAPLLVGFVRWVIEDAKHRGLERLYFVARDGQVLHKIAQELTAELDMRYLYGSRQAWYGPSAFKADREDLEFVLMPGQSSAPRHNLKRVNFAPEAFAPALARYGFTPATWDTQLADDDAVARFWAFIEDPEVAPRIMQRAAETREMATAYFEQEGLLQDDRWALVDVGWTLRTQGSLHKMLRAAGQPHTLGYYLGISKTRFPSAQYGQGRAYLLEDAENEMLEPVRTLFENKGLIDQVFTMADHGSTKGYALEEGRYVPVLGTLPEYPERLLFLQTVQRLVSTFAAELAKSPAYAFESELHACARKVTGMLLAQPTHQEAKALAWAPISDDPNELRAAPLAKPLGLATLYRIGRSIFSRLRQLRAGRRAGNQTVPSLFYKDLSWGFSWLEGSAALSGPLGKLALWAFRTLQYVNREKKAIATRPVRWWQQLERLGRERP